MLQWLVGFLCLYSCLREPDVLELTKGNSFGPLVLVHDSMSEEALNIGIFHASVVQLISLVEFLLGLGDITCLRFLGTNKIRSCSPLELQMGAELFSPFLLFG